MSEIDWQALWPMLLFGAVLLIMFWLVILRPVHVQQHRHRQLLASLAEGDRIVTAGGIYGKIVSLADDEIDIEVADRCVITFDRRAVRRVLDRPGAIQQGRAS